MPIEDRKLKAGVVLKARHKGREHSCEVVKTADGLRYKLKDGKEFKSPSAAGSEITGGAVNGWRFWSLDGDLKPRKAKTGKRATTTASKKASKKSATKAGKKKVARSATKGDAYGCGVCGETFTTMKKATEHALTHTAPR